MRDYLYNIWQMFCLSCCLLSGPWALAQSQVQIHTHVVPPYLNRIVDYASNPQLMVVTVTNTGTQEVQVQLTASLTGDNGISAWVKPDFRSPAPTIIQPGQTINLNGNDIAFLFDVTKIEYSGISHGDIARGLGLLEGNYTLCIRALDYQTMRPLSPEQPLGCATFRLSDLEPPRVLSPFNEQVVDNRGVQAIPITWTTPPGSSPLTQYNVKIVEMVVPRDPNDAIQSTTPLLETTVNSNMLLYGPQHPALIPGRQYAMVVQAEDPTGRSNFRNRGISEVTSFIYGTDNTLEERDFSALTEGAMVAMSAPRAGAVPDCASCKVNLPAGGALAQELAVSSLVKINHFDMQVVSVSASANGRFSGTGTVVLPKLGQLSKQLKLRVQFENIEIKTQGNQQWMTEGLVTGIVRGDFGFMPSGTPPEMTTLPLNSGQVNELDQYFRNTGSQLVSNMENAANSVGFELPLGVDKGPFTIGVTDVFFNATQSWFEAVSVMNMADANTKVAFSGRGICIHATDFCKEAQLYLAEDVAVGNTGLKLKGENGETFIKFDQQGFQELSISASYLFQPGTLTNAESGAPAEAVITAKTKGGWSNWIGEARVKPFKIGVSNDFIFGKGNTDVVMLYDHSDVEIAKHNNTQMPGRFESGDPGDAPIIISPDWTGFYIPEVIVQLPNGINKLAGERLEFIARELLYEQGISGKVETAGRLVELGNGSLDGWYASVDAVGLQFWKNSLKSGYMRGKLVLPASGDDLATANQIDYTCNLTKPANSDLQFELVAQPKNGLNFKALWTTVNIDNASKITVAKRGQERISATAVLHGSMAFKTDIKHLPDLTLGSLTFEDMKLSTQANPRYFDPGRIRFQTGGGQSAYLEQYNLGELYAFHTPRGPSAPEYAAYAPVNSPAIGGSVIGFSITETKVSPYIQGNNIGFSFAGSLQLVKGVNFIPKANVGFSVIGKIGETGDGKRKFWSLDRGKLDSVRLDVGAKLGPVDVQGSIFYQNVQVGNIQDYALSGRLRALLPAMGGGISMQALFGSRKMPNDQFNYFYLDASVELPTPGITMFPGTALYGFAGGFYYNMDVKKAPVTADGTAITINEMDDGEVSKDQPASISITSFSGNTYTVQANRANGSNFGIMAGVYFGLSSRNTLEGLLALDIGLNTSRGFRHFILDGKIAVMSGNQASFTDRHKNAMVQGHMKLEIMMNPNDGKFQSFSAGGGYQVKFPNTGVSLMSGSGNVAFYIDRDDKWYFHLGKPTNPNSMEFLSFIKTSSYFQIGNHEIDPMPDIPPRINEIMGLGNGKSHSEENSSMNNGTAQKKSSRKPQAMDRGLEFNFGASVEIKAKPQFLIFYADLYAALGFDVSVQQLAQATSCGQRAGDWYARGQAYVGAEAGCGVRVRVFGIRKEIEFVRAGLAATMEAGAPAPLYASGTIGGSFSVLGGLVKGSFNIKATLGTPCVEHSSRELKLIADLSPGEEDVSIYAKPAVSFNYPLDWDFVVPITQVNNKDEIVGVNYEVYRLKNDPSYLNISVTKNGQNAYRHADFRKSGQYLLYLDSDQSLDPESAYKIDARAKVKLLNLSLVPGHNTRSTARAYAQANLPEPQFSFVRERSGRVYEDARDTTFTTDRGPKRIELAQLEDIMPIHRHRSMPYESVPNREAYLQLTHNTPLTSYDHGLVNPRAYARVVTVNGGQEAMRQDVPITLSADHREWKFNLPALVPNNAYAIRIFLRGDLPPTQEDNSIGTRLAAQSTIRMVGAEATINRREIIQNSLELATNEHELFSWYFNTGQYKTYGEKMNALKLERMLIGDKEIDINTPEVNLANFSDEGNVIRTITSYTLHYFGPEYFNRMDNGKWTVGEVFPDVGNHNKGVVLGNTNYVGFLSLSPYIAPPAGYTAAIDEFFETAFRGQKVFKDDIFRNEYSATAGQFFASSMGGFSSQSSLLPHDLYGIHYKENTYRIPKQDDVWDASDAGAEQTEGRTVADIVLNSYANQVLVPSAVQSLLSGSANKHVYSFSVSMDYRPGKGVVNTSNLLLQRALLRTQQGYPTDILKPMGVMIDQMTQSIINTPVQVPQIGTQRVPTIRLR